MRTGWVFLAATLAGAPSAGAQTHLPLPRLVVVIVIDQFRSDYPERFRQFFSPGGFNLFFRRGAVFSRARYEHGVLFTCPGHAVVMTGSYADVNGIVSNSWYDRKTGRETYCAEDSAATLVGTAGTGTSPRRLMDSTLGDVLKRTSDGRSRVVAVAGKDRSAVMLGGHLADAVYWTSDTLMVSSTYYRKDLPPWVKHFNASGRGSRYLGRTWARLLPDSGYTQLGPDAVPAERSIAGMGTAFPHRPPPGASHGQLLMAFESSPFHNELVAEFAMEAVNQEHLGRHPDPDLLAIGFSANDLIGHEYGPDSQEVMDATVRTDRLLERLFGFLDRTVGLERVVLVITGDHGVAPLPDVVRRRSPELGAGFVDPSVIRAAVDSALGSRYGAPGGEDSSWVAFHDHPYIYLNLPALERRGVDPNEARAVARDAIRDLPQVELAVTASELEQQRREGHHTNGERSFYPGRSGDLYYQLRPYLLPQRSRQGTTHGAIWPYDTDVALLWYGAGIVPGRYDGPAAPSDIAPTLASLLGIPPPPGYEGRALTEILR